jgi:hypothetical protein
MTLPRPHVSKDHPVVLQFLDSYVRKPLDGTFLDQYVFSPTKTLYLTRCCSHATLHIDKIK